MALPAWALLTLEEAKQHVKVEDDADDALIERAIVAATRYIERFCGRLFVQRSLTEPHTGDEAVQRRTVLRLYWRPVVSVEAVTVDGAAITDYTLDAPGARLKRLSGWPPSSTIVVRYTAGHAPDATTLADDFADVLEAVRKLVADWYENREAVVVGTVTEEMEHSVSALLAPYRAVHL